VPGLGDRQNDIAEPLLQIALLAGNGWSEKLIAALRTVFGTRSDDDDSLGAVLLSDIRAIFEERKRDEIPSKELAGALLEIEGRPWAEWSKGRGISANSLALLLRKYGIHPANIRVGDKIPKGYRRADFEDAWQRYCVPFPLSPPISTATPLQPASPLNETLFSNRYTPPHVAVAKSAPNPHEYRSVAAVAVQTRGDRETETRKDDPEPSVSPAGPRSSLPPNSHERPDYRRKALVAQALRDIESLLKSGAISGNGELDTEYFLARIQGQPEDVLAALEMAVEQGLLAGKEDLDD
jgi:hypothetical protein